MNKLYELEFYNTLIDTLEKAKAGSIKRSDRIYDAFGKAAKEVDSENQASSDMGKRVVQSFHKARAELGAWNKIADQAYVAQRNRVLGI